MPFSSIGKVMNVWMSFKLDKILIPWTRRHFSLISSGSKRVQVSKLPLNSQGDYFFKDLKGEECNLSLVHRIWTRKNFTANANWCEITFYSSLVPNIVFLVRLFAHSVTSQRYFLNMRSILNRFNSSEWVPALCNDIFFIPIWCRRWRRHMLLKNSPTTLIYEREFTECNVVYFSWDTVYTCKISSLHGRVRHAFRKKVFKSTTTKSWRLIPTVTSEHQRHLIRGKKKLFTTACFEGKRHHHPCFASYFPFVQFIVLSRTLR